ncbi:putative membrane protein (plasmid) [Bacillus thuringiensis MC28]|nr:putative membrane protein [Bacillus thuringiensis MC28]
MFVLLFGLEQLELSYAVIAWLAWLPNLIVAELFIRQRLNKGQYQENEDLHF